MSNTTGQQGLILPSKVYDVLKPTTQIVLPAIGTFYFALALLWGFPEPDKVVGTITALVTLLGVILGLSTQAYNSTTGAKGRIDGNLDISAGDSSQIHQLEIITDPQHLGLQDTVTFKVNKVSSEV